jgi:hypothetical protein
MTPIITVLAVRVTVASALALGALIANSQSANAFSLRVKVACAADYYANCTAHSPDSPETRSCMRAVGSGLSHGCVDALVAAGEVSAEEVARRRSSLRSAAK